MGQKKAKLVTALFSMMLLGVLLNAAVLWRESVPWILGAFALPGAWRFARVLYIWLQLPEKENELEEDEKK